MSRVVLRPATRADFDAMLAEPLPYRVRALAAERDGDLLGVGGIAFQPNGVVAAFVQMRPGAHRYKVALHKAGLRMMDDVKRLGIRRVVATAEKGNAAAAPWLVRLGFRPEAVNGETVWVWTR